MNFLLDLKAEMARNDDLVELSYPTLGDEKANYAPVGGLVGELNVRTDKYQSSPRSISGIKHETETQEFQPKPRLKLEQNPINEEPNCCERAAVWLDQTIIWYRKEYLPDEIIGSIIGFCIGLGLIIGGVFLMHAYNTIPKYDCDDPQNACTFYTEDDIDEDFVVNCLVDPFPICENCTGNCLRGKFYQTLCFERKCAEDEKENADGYQTGAVFMFIIGGIFTVITGFFVCAGLPMLFLIIARKIFFCY